MGVLVRRPWRPCSATVVAGDLGGAGTPAVDAHGEVRLRPDCMDGRFLGTERGFHAVEERVRPRVVGDGGVDDVVRCRALQDVDRRHLTEQGSHQRKLFHE